MAVIPSQVVVLDTCVLLSNVLRRFLLQLAQHSLFIPAWSDIIADEWQRNASKLWKYFPLSIAEQWQALEQAFPDANMGQVEQFKQGLRYSDPKDWHVVAAARAAQQRWPEHKVMVLTRNLKDFNRSELRRLGLGLAEPDHYLYEWAVREPGLMTDMLSTLPALMVSPQAQDMPPIELLRRDRLFRLAQFFRMSEARA